MPMKLTIQVPPDIEADLLVQARAEGLDLAEYVQNLIRGQVKAKTTADFSRPAHELSTEQRRQNLRAWAKSHRGNIVVLADKDMERASIYGDHGCSMRPVLAFNGGDFKRYPDIFVLHPAQI